MVIVVFTLTPGGGGGVSALSFCILCGAHGLADVLRNIVLFLPFGVALAARGRSARRVLITVTLFSLGIEVVQLTGLQGRHANPVDVLSNTAGAMLGWAMVRTAPSWTAPARHLRRRLLAIALISSIAILVGSRALLAPSPTAGTYYGQWTADFGNAETYGGEVRAAGIGEALIPGQRMGDTDGVRNAFAARSPILIRFAAGPATVRLAPLLSVYDDRQREIFLVGIEGEDLVIRYRTRALSLRLDQPSIRIAGALSGVRPGETARLRIDWKYGSSCATVNGRVSCATAIDARRGWAFLWALRLDERVQKSLDHFWIAFLLLPVGFWSRGRAEGIPAMAALCAILPFVLHPAGLLGVAMAALAGFVVGQVLAWRVRTGDPYPTRDPPPAFSGGALRRE